MTRNWKYLVVKSYKIQSEIYRRESVYWIFCKCLHWYRVQFGESEIFPNRLAIFLIGSRKIVFLLFNCNLYNVIYEFLHAVLKPTIMTHVGSFSLLGDIFHTWRYWTTVCMLPWIIYERHQIPIPPSCLEYCSFGWLKFSPDTQYIQASTPARLRLIPQIWLELLDYTKYAPLDDWSKDLCGNLKLYLRGWKFNENGNVTDEQPFTEYSTYMM